MPPRSLYTRSCIGCSGAIPLKSKFGGIDIFPGKASHGEGSGGEESVMLEIVGSVYWVSVLLILLFVPLLFVAVEVVDAPEIEAWAEGTGC